MCAGVGACRNGQDKVVCRMQPRVEQVRLGDGCFGTEFEEGLTCHDGCT